MTDLELYCTSILDGKINACRRIKQVCERLLEDLYNPGQWHFDHHIARRHVDFIEKFCKVPSGRLGQPLKLELFQKARLEAIFGFVDDEGLRRYTEVMILEGRKNGKTTETAAVEIDLLVNDGEGSPQIYNVATKMDQAKLGYVAARKMVQLSPLLNKHLRRRVSDIYNPRNLGYIQPLASNTSAMDGLDVHGAAIDELSAIKNRDLYDLIKQGTGARDQPLIFVITTNGFIRNGVFDAQYKYACNVLDGVTDDPRFLPFLYELDSPDEWDKEECWVKANPGIGTIKKLVTLRGWVQKAKNDPSFKPTVMVKDFNLPQTSTAAWLHYEELNNETVWSTDPANKFDYCIGGFDAADTTDLNAAKAICMRPDDPHIYVRSMYWIPQAVLDKQAEKGTRQERDNVPYTLWVEQGLMRTCPGNKCDKRVFLEWFRELRDKEDLYVLYIGYDPWHVDDTLLRDFKAEFGPNCMVPIRQGPYTLSQPMKDLRADFQAGLVVYDNNPIDKWCLINTEVKTDTNGNIQPVKSLDPRRRIDGTVALLCGYTVLQDKKDMYINLN